MGVLRPPWISKAWFSKYPFNYCDHFGNQEVLASVCKICKEDAQRKQFYKKAGKDPNDLKYVLQDIADNFAKAHRMIVKDVKRLGIDINNLPHYEDSAPKPETYPIFTIIRNYCDYVEKVISNLSAVPVDTNTQLVIKVVDALTHSRNYAIAKTARALNSQYEENNDPLMKDLADSKTSALFTYIAIERNSRALLALARHRPLRELREKHLRFAAISLEIAQMLQDNFFPEDNLIYEEFGCEEYDKQFKKKLRIKSAAM